ncbi:MAG: polysaccharide deacetylase family protein [Clostridia bacterium]
MKVFIITKRTLLTIAIAVTILIGAIILLVTTGKGASPTSVLPYIESYELDMMTGANKELPIYSVERSDKKIALTIDAAWEDDKTDFILDELKKNDIKATFFLCGFWAEKYPDHVKAIIASGNEIGNHSSTHPHMNKLSANEISAELKKYDDLLFSITGTRSKIFRPPYGEYNDAVIKTVRANGYEVIQWNIDTIDWREERSAQTILDTVLPKLTPGSIILCHNNGFKIKEYLPILIAKAKEQGYEFVTVSELLLSGNTKIDVNGIQKQG